MFLLPLQVDSFPAGSPIQQRYDSGMLSQYEFEGHMLVDWEHSSISIADIKVCIYLHVKYSPRLG